MNRANKIRVCLLLVWGLAAPAVCAQGISPIPDSQPAIPPKSSSLWHYGAYLSATR